MFGSSHIGLTFLLLLFIPNILWASRQPQGYTTQNENKFLLILERAGEGLTTVCALIFRDFNLHDWSN